VFFVFLTLVLPIQSFLPFSLLLPLPLPFFFFLFMCSCIFHVSHSPSLCFNFIYFILFFLLYVSPSPPLSLLFFSFYLSVHFPIPFLVHSSYHSISISPSFFLVFSISLTLHLTVRFCFRTPSVTPCHNRFPSFFLCVFLSFALSHSPFCSSSFIFQFYFIINFFFIYSFFLSPSYSHSQYLFFCFSSLFYVFPVSHSPSPSPKYFLPQFYFILF
jgi:hypothetical protein